MSLSASWVRARRPQVSVSVSSRSRDRPDDRLRGAGAVLEQHPGAGAQRLVGEPADGRVELGVPVGGASGGGDQVAAGDVDVVGQQQRHAAARAGDVQRRRRRCRCRSTVVRSPTAARRPRRPARRCRPRPGRRSRGSRGARRSAAGSRTAPGTGRRVRCGPASPAPTPGAPSSVGPAYQAICAERSTTLSPCSAEIGIARRVVGEPELAGVGRELLGDRGRTPASS